MAKTNIQVQGVEVRVQQNNFGDFVCLTDIAKSAEQPTDYTIRNWLRNRNTIEFLGVWERLHNDHFNPAGFDGIRMKSGLNNFSPSTSEWIGQTNAIGIVSTAGRYGGTYAHIDIAIHFSNWLNPEFYAYFIEQFRKLKEGEAARLGERWDLRRELAKGNYFIHTDAVRTNLIPMLDWNTKQESFHFASEADLLNLAVFQCTAKQWKAANTDKKGNMRDYATIEELQVLANMEAVNAMLLEQGFMQDERLVLLTKRAERELAILQSARAMESVKRLK